MRIKNGSGPKLDPIVAFCPSSRKLLLFNRLFQLLHGTQCNCSIMPCAFSLKSTGNFDDLFLLLSITYIWCAHCYDVTSSQSSLHIISDSACPEWRTCVICYLVFGRASRFRVFDFNLDSTGISNCRKKRCSVRVLYSNHFPGYLLGLSV